MANWPGSESCRPELDTGLDMAARLQVLLQGVRAIILASRDRAIRGIDRERVAMYWKIGQYIVKDEQGGAERAEYGAGLLDALSEQLEPEFGSGFSARRLRSARQFYRTYPVWNAVRSELNWYQYRTLISIDDPDKREFYELESVRGGWSGRETERQATPVFSNGFAFIARQRRLLLEDDEFFVDLVCYNRLLRCFVLFELKRGRLTHQDLGQLQMYVNYYDRQEKLPDENPTVGVLLCTSKNDAVVRFSLPRDNTTILASQYQLYLPTEDQLVAELKREIAAVASATGREEDHET